MIVSFHVLTAKRDTRYVREEIWWDAAATPSSHDDGNKADRIGRDRLLCEQSGHGPPDTSTMTTNQPKTARKDVDSTNKVKEGTATQPNHTTSYLATDDDTANTMLQEQKAKQKRNIHIPVVERKIYAKHSGTSTQQ